MPKTSPSLTPMTSESDYEVTWKKIVFSVGISESGTNSKEVSRGWDENLEVNRERVNEKRESLN